MSTVQAPSGQQQPSARSDRIFGRIGVAGIDLGQLDLRASKALFGGGQQPPDGLRMVAFDRVTAIAQPVFVHDSEIELRLGITSSGGLKQMFFQVNYSSTSGIASVPPPR